MTNSALVVTVAVILLKSALVVAGDECSRVNACSCMYPNGTGIDLNQMIDITDKYLEAQDPITQDKYFFHPCSNINYLPDEKNDDSNACSKGDGYAVCRQDNATKAYHKLGTAKNSSFHASEDGQLYLVFHQNALVTSFQLLCLKHDSSFIFVKNSAQLRAGNETNFLLFSSYACPITIEEIHRTSAGSVLLILFIIGSFTYFTIGAIVRYMYLGARGIEVIPNLDFWSNLPGLVRDGFQFVRNGCRVERTPDPDSYDAI